jgi:hypothetical protein
VYSRESQNLHHVSGIRKTFAAEHLPPLVSTSVDIAKTMVNQYLLNVYSDAEIVLSRIKRGGQNVLLTTIVTIATTVENGKRQARTFERLGDPTHFILFENLLGKTIPEGSLKDGTKFRPGKKNVLVGRTLRDCEMNECSWRD